MPEVWGEESLKKGAKEGKTMGTLFQSGNLEAKTGAEKFGKGTERVAEFLLPGGKVNKASNIIAEAIGKRVASRTTGSLLNTGAQVALRGAEGAGVTALQTGGDTEEMTKAGIINAVFPAAAGAFKAAKGALPIAKGILKRTAAGITGRGTAVFDAIAENPKAALEAFAKEPYEVLKQNATKLKQTVKGIGDMASADYAKSLDELPKRLGRSPEVTSTKGSTTIKVDGKKYVLSLRGIRGKLTEALRNFGVDVDPKKAEFDFTESPFVGPEEAVLKKAFGYIQNWTDTTPKGIDALAVKIGRLRKNGIQSPQLNSVIDGMKRNVRGYLGDRVPQAKEMVERFAKAQDEIEALDQSFATDGKIIGGTAERMQTEKKLAQVFGSGEKSGERALLEGTAGGKEILTSEAARQLMTAPEKNAGKVGELIRSTIDIVLPPKMIGKIAARLSQLKTPEQVSGALAKFISILKKADTAERAAIIQLFNDDL